MNRSQRKMMAEETLRILESGIYKSPSGKTIDISSEISQAVKSSSHIRADGIEEIKNVISAPLASKAHNTTLSVTNETSLEASRRLLDAHPHHTVSCLNFASANNPGGGFLNGSQAQEESLARSSALHSTLVEHWAFYEENRNCGSPLYNDNMIASPETPVFRDDDGGLLDEPYTIGFITTPAPNAGAMLKRDPRSDQQIQSTFTRRIDHALAVAVHIGTDRLVLGAWGCGVFKNDPLTVARHFELHLGIHGRYHGAFHEVVFAILDSTTEGRFIKPFQSTFR